MITPEIKHSQLDRSLIEKISGLGGAICTMVITVMMHESIFEKNPFPLMHIDLVSRHFVTVTKVSTFLKHLFK